MEALFGTGCAFSGKTTRWERERAAIVQDASTKRRRRLFGSGLGALGPFRVALDPSDVVVDLKSGWSDRPAGG